MQMWALVRWWYGPGWVHEVHILRQRMDRVSDYFSIPLLFRTLFQPFRQIDAAPHRGGLDVQLRALVDGLMSRFIGASARLILMIIGSVWWLVSALTAIAWLALWPLLPLSPLFGVLLTVLGVGA